MSFFLTLTPTVPYWRLQMTQIFQLAFHNQLVFRWFHRTIPPGTPSSPADLSPDRTRWWLRVLTLYSLNPRVTQLLAIKGTRVIGCAQWLVPPHLARRQSLFERVYCLVLQLWHDLQTRLFPPRWLNIKHWEMRGHTRNSQKDPWQDVLGDEEFHRVHILDIVWVAPEEQGRGVGTALIQWGLERARRMQMGVVLATDIGGMTEYYAKFGFRTFDMWRYGDEDGSVERNLMIWKV